MSLSVVDHCGDHFEYLVNFFGYADNLWSSMNFYSEILVVQKSYQSTLRQFYKSYISFKVSYTRVPDTTNILLFMNLQIKGLPGMIFFCIDIEFAL